VNTTEQFDAGNGDGSRCEGLEAEHRPGSALDTAVILFNQVVQVFGRSQLCTPGQQTVLSHLAYGSMRGSIAVECDGVRQTPRLLEEGLGRSHIACSAQPEVNGLPCLVDCSVQVDQITAS
jgi:hypothetical protein